MFPTTTNTDHLKTPAGEIVGEANILIAQTNFELGLVFGRFAKLDAGRIDNMDGSGAPAVVGLVIRDLTNPIEDGLTYSTEHTRKISLCKMGLATVEAIAGETPDFYAPIYARNSGAGDMGKASVASANGVLTDARFVAKITDTVWLVMITGQAPSGVTVTNNFAARVATVATLPAAAGATNQVYLVTDGAAGEPVQAYSDGTAWVKLDGTGDAPSAT